MRDKGDKGFRTGKRLSGRWRRRDDRTSLGGESRYREMLDSLNDVVFNLDARGCFTYASGAISRISQYGEDDVVGRPFVDFVHPDDLPGLFESLESTLAGNEEPYEFRVIDRDGSHRLVRTSSRPLFRGGELSGLVGVMTDITEQRLAAEEAARFKAIADNAGYGVAIVDIEGNMVYVNRSFAEAHGYAPGELYGRNPSIFHNEEQFSRVIEIMEGVIEGSEYGAVEVWHTRRDGAVFPMLMNLVIIRDEAGNPAYVATSAIDISEIKQREEELRRYRESLEEMVEERTLEIMKANERLQKEIMERKRIGEELEAKNRELDAFAHTVSHDLRGSLSLIRGFAITAQSASEREKREELEECLCHIVEAARRMEEFVTSILAYSSAGYAEDIGGSVDSGRILREVLEENRAEIEDRGVLMAVPDALPAVRADAARLYQVLSNIIGNSVKYTAHNRKPRIEVKCSEEAGMAVFCISDNGIGISEQEQAHVFEPFRRCGGFESPGLGIGLSTVKRAVEGWRGEIWLESTPGEGTSFYFSVPLCAG